MNVSHMSAALQAKAFADAAAYNEQAAERLMRQWQARTNQRDRTGQQMITRINAHRQFAKVCREECWRLQQVTQGRGRAA